MILNCCEIKDLDNSLAVVMHFQTDRVYLILGVHIC